MIKKGVCLLFILSMLLLLSGCWDYRGLNDMTVVLGVAVDKDPDNGYYHLSFETVDFSVSVIDNGPKGKIIESEGETLFDAVRNAKKRITNKLYFGQTQVVVISNEIVRSEDISDMINWFLRDGECHETLSVLISQEQTAAAILGAEGVYQGIVSSELKNIEENDQKVTSSTLNLELYKVYQTLKAEGKTLALSAVHNVTNDDVLANEVNGTAVFNDDNRLVGYLTPEESKYFLFAVDGLKGGVLPFLVNGESGTLEISSNKTKSSFVVENGKVKITIKTDTDVYLDEYMGYEDALDEKQTAALEDAVAKELEANISNVIKKVQSEFGSDIFGFGNMIYKKDYKLWDQLKSTWGEQFPFIEVEVQSKIHILNTASLKES